MLVVKNLPAIAGNVRDAGSSLELGRSTGGGHGNALQYSCLENPMNRGAWRATVHGIAKSQTQLKQLSPHSLLQRSKHHGMLCVTNRIGQTCCYVSSEARGFLLSLSDQSLWVKPVAMSWGSLVERAPVSRPPYPGIKATSHQPREWALWEAEP